MGAATAYGAIDRWALLQNTCAARVSISQDTDVPADAGFGYSQKIDCTTVDSSVAAGDLLVLLTKVEGQNIQHLLWGDSAAKTVTLSFWGKTDRSGGGTMSVSLQSAGTDYWAKSVALTSTWTKFTIVIPGSQGTAPVNDTSTELHVAFALVAGTTFQQTAETWSTSSTYAVSGQTNLMDNTGTNVWLTGVQLEVGSIATDFAHEGYGTTLAKCQRYYWQQAFANDKYIAAAYIVSTTVAAAAYAFPVTMRAVPTGGVSGTTLFEIDHAGTETQSSNMSVSGNTESTASIVMSVSSGLTLGQSGVMGGGTAGQAVITFSAEL